MAKQIIEFCDCGCRAKYWVSGEPLCTSCLFIKISRQVKDCIHSSMSVSVKVTGNDCLDIRLVNPERCEKKPECNYWRRGCILDNCVLE